MLVVSNRISVVAGHEAEFEALFEERSGMAVNRAGLHRLYLLRPIEAHTYVIQAYWESRDAFEEWRASEDFKMAYADLPNGLFTGPNHLGVHDLWLEYDDG